jgi:hypothetical protein
VGLRAAAWAGCTRPDRTTQQGRPGATRGGFFGGQAQPTWALGVRLGGMLSLYVAADDYIYGTRIDQAQLSVGFGFPVGG